MKAEEARKLTAESAKEVAIDHLLNIVYPKIKAAAKDGKRSIVDPFQGMRGTMTAEQSRAVWIALQAEGYEVIHHQNPDPGHPASRPYTEIKW